MDCHALLQGIFLSQGWNPGLLHCRQILYHLSHQGSPAFTAQIFSKERDSDAFGPPEGAMLNGLVPAIPQGTDTGQSKVAETDCAEEPALQDGL